MQRSITVSTFKGGYQPFNAASGLAALNKAGQFLILKAYDAPALETPAPFDCSRTAIRSPAETKGRVPFSTSTSSLGSNPANVCEPDCDC